MLGPGAWQGLNQDLGHGMPAGTPPHPRERMGRGFSLSPHGALSTPEEAQPRLLPSPISWFLLTKPLR